LGENGSGKSTFLQSLAERDIAIPEHIDIYMVRGEAAPSDQGPVDFIVAAAKEKVERLEKRVEELSGSTDEADTEEIERLLEEIEDMDPSTFEAKAGSILHGLGFSQQMMARPTKDMSGGWRMRVALARALFIKPHLLLLGTLSLGGLHGDVCLTSRIDEPTNHLDLGAVVWLEAYLSTYNHILVITSHSADFLDSVCTNTIELTPKKKVRDTFYDQRGSEPSSVQLVYYGGNYSTFVRTKSENEVNQMKAYNKQQEEIAHIKKHVPFHLLASLSLHNDPCAGSSRAQVPTPTLSSKPSRSRKLSTRWRQQVWWRKLKCPSSCASTLRTSENCHRPLLPSMM
jgi:ATP-binding cassette subfamily F protein 2